MNYTAIHIHILLLIFVPHKLIQKYGKNCQDDLVCTRYDQLPGHNRELLMRQSVRGSTRVGEIWTTLIHSMFCLCSRVTHGLKC